MKIEQVNVRHRTWHTRVTVGEGDDAKTFGLQMLPDGQARLHIPFDAKKQTTEDFGTLGDALMRCER